MAFVSYDRAAAVHATTQRSRLAWGRLFALAFAVGSWATIFAAARAIF
ncbi:hypothetical protein [Caulobacter sp.]|nr:hypothetical protein [Caulobacter sp.]HJV43884.1 hypothetical protein [Caulobacter sp.]